MSDELAFFLAEEQADLASQVRDLGEKEIQPLLEKDLPEEELARELVRALGRGRLLRHLVPDAFGGTADTVSLRTLCRIREGLAWHHGMAEFLFAMQGLGSYPITLAGTPDLKRKFLPPVAAGEMIAAFAITEEMAGSDVAAMETTAQRSQNEWILNGTKTLISNAGLADFYVVFAKSDPAKGNKGISAFVVEKDAPGFSVSKKLEVMAPHPLGELKFDGCRIPAENLLGGTGEGFKIAMRTLDLLRTTVGAAALGLARRAMDESLQRVQERSQFGKNLAAFQGVQLDLAEMETRWEAARLLVYRSAWAKDGGAERVTKESAMAKYYATEAANWIIDRAVQLHGGQGVIRGNAVERLYREIRALRIYEGTSEILKMVIARSLLEK